MANPGIQQHLPQRPSAAAFLYLYAPPSYDESSAPPSYERHGPLLPCYRPRPTTSSALSRSRSTASLDRYQRRCSQRDIFFLVLVFVLVAAFGIASGIIRRKH
ncbi:unnamed protein product [Cercospora beticola]|nr:unnamed protein product [Cercospora beticola]